MYTYYFYHEFDKEYSIVYYQYFFINSPNISLCENSRV